MRAYVAQFKKWARDVGRYFSKDNIETVISTGKDIQYL